ncbi:MAG: ATP synthase F1 subunit epsilon [Monoglobales bacterium]
MNSFELKILSADKPFYDGISYSLTVPTHDGSYGILAHHHNVITAVVPGLLYFTDSENVTQTVVVSNGIVKVEKNNVLILVETAERPEEIDENRARRAAEAAKEELLQKKGILEYHIAQKNMARAISRLKAKNKNYNL